jgi:hypothetical protein
MESIFVAFFRRPFVVTALVSLTLCSHSQGLAPHLSFMNPTLDSGTAGADKAVYRFASVTTGVDALVRINGRSSANVELNDIDITSTGYDSAFQPLVNYTNGSNIKNNVVTDWYMEFQVSFVTAGTKTATTVAAFNATGLDDDGNTSLHEYLSFYGLSTYTLESPTALTTSNILSGSTVVGKRFDGATTEYSGIDVTATTVMVTTNYLNTNSFIVRTGGKAMGPINISNNGRQYSLWFKSFNYITPVISTLPISIASFTAQLNNATEKVALDWATSSEINASHFVVQRSTDGNEYNDMAMVFAQEGNSSSDRDYNYSDDISAVNGALIYYRLKMVDIDGQFKYSEIAVVRIAKSTAQAKLTVYPNPVLSELRVTIPDSWQNKLVTYNIYNISGSLLRSATSSHAGQTESFSVSDLPVGTYIIRAANGNDQSAQQFVRIR